MVLVRISDKRYNHGYRLKFFQTDTITEEIVQFVKGNPKVCWVESKNENYYSRDEFLQAYSKF